MLIRFISAVSGLDPADDVGFGTVLGVSGGHFQLKETSISIGHHAFIDYLFKVGSSRL